MTQQSKLPSSPDAAWPIILPFIGKPRSAVDFGCGSGHWLASLQRLIPDIDVIGVNSSERDDAGLALRNDQFRHADLTQPIDLGRKFDLGICIEVGEHLPASAADTLVNSIRSHSDVVLFGSAIPNQRGIGHVNEQWPHYWIDRFAGHGFDCFDRLRPLVWHKTDISIWYRQNMMLFMKSPRKPLIDGKDWHGASIVHPQYFEWASLHKKRSLSNLLRFVTGQPQI